MKSDTTPTAVPWAWPLALLLAGLLASAAAGLWQRRDNAAWVDVALATEAERMAERLRRRMQTYETGVVATRSAIAVAGRSVQEITREQFERFGTSLDMERLLPGLGGVAFIRRVDPAGEAAFVAGMRREGFDDFRIREVAPNPDERFVIQYVTPLREGNQAMLGLDIASDPPRRAAALEAARSGEARLSAPFALENDPSRAPRAFALMLPIYRSGHVLPPPPQREAEAFGWASVRMVMDEVLHDFDRGDGVALAVSDVTLPQAPVAFHASADWRAGAALPLREAVLPLYGRRWQVQVQALPAFAARLPLRNPLAPAAIGAGASVLLALLLQARLHSARRQRAAQARFGEINATLEQQVRLRTAELQAILDSAASAIVATDLESRVIAFNPAAEGMLGLPAAQALGRSMLDFYDPVELRERVHQFPAEIVEHATELPAGLRQALRHGPAPRDGERSEWTYVRADGTRFPGLLSLSLLRDDRGQPHGFLAVIVDLSERKALERALEQRTRQAEAASEAKSAFLAHMSHEFRTPLNAVIGLSQLMAQLQDLPPRARHFVRHIEQAGTQLLALTDDVLDLSRVEAGELRLELAPFDLDALLQTLSALVQPQAAAKGLALRLERAPQLPARLRGDALRLRQVLLNLLGNAVKFTERGEVRLWVHGDTPEAGRVRLHLEVSDSGIGIEPALQQRIFEPFAQADASTTRRFGGTGLGLSIVRRLVGLMGGEIALQSTPGQGSTFTVTVVLEVDGPAA
ncbi:sensor histidine kinase [Azohydromonas aeria]|uniref:sensor histidine kinase n=1 Tax=Azohydromonas aeria TaxID=2590212 RepID=UPI0018DF15CD|nr:CHASE domain-containing protein [Azohydromonas aeria]